MIISILVSTFITASYLTIARFSFENINYENELAVNRSKSSQASGRIVGGKKVGVTGGYPFPVPWDVALVCIDRKESIRDIICGGCLLSNEYVLTAAHCGEEFEAKYEYRLLVGSTSKKDIFDESKLHEISSSRIIHEKYESFEAPDGTEFCVYDFMIIKFLKRLNLCPNKFARLPIPEMDDQLLRGKTLLASGWGAIIKISRERTKEIATNPEKPIPQVAFPDQLRAVEIPYLSNKICQKRHHDFFTEEYANIKGTKNTLVQSLNFESTSGSDAGASMGCTSFCVKEDITGCRSDLKPSGSCVGDS